MVAHQPFNGRGSNKRRTSACKEAACEFTWSFYILTFAQLDATETTQGANRRLVTRRKGCSPQGILVRHRFSYRCRCCRQGIPRPERRKMAKAPMDVSFSFHHRDANGSLTSYIHSFVTFFWPREVRHSKLQAIHAKITDQGAPIGNGASSSTLRPPPAKSKSNGSGGAASYRAGGTGASARHGDRR